MILDPTGTQLVAVVYYQHGDWYTRLASDGGFETDGTHPVVHVGKIDHGNFHNQGGIGACGYWEDFHNYSNPSLHLDTWTNLVPYHFDPEPLDDGLSR